MTVEELRNELIEISKTEPYSLGDICRMYANLIQTGLDSERSLSILKAGSYHEYMLNLSMRFDSTPMVEAFKELANSNTLINKFKRLIKKFVDYLG